jgi:hypothetical protein
MSPGRPPGARLEATFKFDVKADAGASHRREDMRKTRIEVANSGEATAEKVAIGVTANGPGRPPLNDWASSGARDIIPGGRESYTVFLRADTATAWKVSLHWEERGVTFTDSQDIYITDP